MERVSSPDPEELHGAVMPAVPQADDVQPLPPAENGSGNGSGNGHAPNTQSAGNDDGSSLVTTPATTRRKPRAKKANGTTTERPKRASRKKIEPPQTPAMAVPVAPLTRPDGTPAPVVHLVPELSPYARTG